MNIDINQVDAQLKANKGIKEIKPFKRDLKSGKIIQACRQCGSEIDVRIDKKVREYLCKKCRKALK